jgi:hypothetical protein
MMRKAHPMHKIFRSAAVGLCMVACFAATAVSAADLAERQPPVCRGGVMTDAVTGRPVMDPTRKDPTPVPCGPVETGIDPLLIGAGALGLATAGLAACAGAGCFRSSRPPLIPPPNPPIFASH